MLTLPVLYTWICVVSFFLSVCLSVSFPLSLLPSPLQYDFTTRAHTALTLLLNIFQYLIVQSDGHSDISSVSHSEVKNQEQVSWRKLLIWRFLCSSRSPSELCWKLLKCLFAFQPCVCDDDAVLLGCRFIVMASRPVQLFSPLMAFSAALYAVCEMIYHLFMMLILLALAASKHPAVTGTPCGVVQPYRGATPIAAEGLTLHSQSKTVGLTLLKWPTSSLKKTSFWTHR